MIATIDVNINSSAMTDILTYFGLLPSEVLLTHIRPHLSVASLVMLRNAYLGTDIPVCLDIFRVMFQEDSISLLEYIGDEYNMRTLMDSVGPAAICEAISLVKSTSMAKVAMTVFDTYFIQHYFKVRFDNKDKLKKYSNRELFAGYFINLEDAAGFIFGGLNKGSIYDPLLPRLFPTYADFPDFFQKLEDETGRKYDPATLLNIACTVQSLELVRKLQTYDVVMGGGALLLALQGNDYNFACQLRPLSNMTDDEWNALCIQHGIVGCLPVNVILQSSIPQLKAFKEYCKCENFEAMEKLRPYIIDDSEITGNFSVSVIKWLYEHKIYPSFDTWFRLEELTPDDLRYLLSLHSSDVKQLRVWKSLALKGRYDLLSVLKEICGSPSFANIATVIEFSTYNLGMCELFYDMGCRTFDIRPRCSMPFEYYQWCHNKDIEYVTKDVDRSLYTLKQSLWLIEHGFDYNNKCWMITAKDICDLPYITQWMTQHTYTIGNAIIVKGHESQYTE